MPILGPKGAKVVHDVSQEALHFRVFARQLFAPQSVGLLSPPICLYAPSLCLLSLALCIAPLFVPISVARAALLVTRMLSGYVVRAAADKTAVTAAVYRGMNNWNAQLVRNAR